MDNWDAYAIEDEDDQAIEAAAMSIDCSQSDYEDDGSTGSIEADPDPLGDSPWSVVSKTDNTSPPGSTVWRTTSNLFSEGSTSRGDAGDSYSTSQSLFGDHTVSRTSSGETYRTDENILSNGTTTYGPDGATYRTSDKLFGEGQVTRGSDGSVYETTKDLFGDGHTTRRK